MSIVDKDKFDVNVWRALPKTAKKDLPDAILSTIQKTIKRQRPKYYPPKELLELLLGEEVRRLVAKLEDCLEHRCVQNNYILIYKGNKGKRAYKIIEVCSNNIADLKIAIEERKPTWALNCRALPIATYIPDDTNYPLVMHWPDMKKPISKRVSDESFRFGSSRRGTSGVFKPNI